MKVIETLDNISDGKLYDIKDMVKADAGGCQGCSACCHDVGELVELTPFDMYEIKRATEFNFSALLEKKVVLREEGKLRIPHLMNHGEKKACGFLNEDGRCSIHGYRPSICRLFPLGRVYEGDDFKYFLQVGACVKPKLDKVKVKKWIGIDNYKENKAFILSWYQFLKAIGFRVKFIRDEEELNKVNSYMIQTFYDFSIEEDMDFYTYFNKVLPEAKQHLGIL